MDTIERNRRRTFLLAATLGAAGTVAAISAARVHPPAAGATRAPPAEGSGYRASSHVLTYYKTTEF